MDNILFVVSGPSGCGKNTLLEHIMAKHSEACHSISATTRPPRFFEQDGIDYHFKTVDEFEGLIENNGLVEWDRYNGNYYGTVVQNVNELIDSGKNVVFDITVKGAENVKKLFPDNSACVFILPPSINTLRNRLIDRKSETIECIDSRIKAAILFEFSKWESFDYVIINDNLEQAKNDIDIIYRAVAGYTDNAEADRFRTQNMKKTVMEAISDYYDEARQLNIVNNTDDNA